MSLPDQTQAEVTRLAAVTALNIDGAGPQADLQALVRTAALVCGMPISLVTDDWLRCKRSVNSLMFLGWRQLFGKSLQEHEVSGIHGSMFDHSNVASLAKAFRTAIVGNTQ